MAKPDAVAKVHEKVQDLRNILKRTPDSLVGNPLIEAVKILLNQADIAFPEKK